MQPVRSVRSRRRRLAQTPPNGSVPHSYLSSPQLGPCTPPPQLYRRTRSSCRSCSQILLARPDHLDMCIDARRSYTCICSPARPVPSMHSGCAAPAAPNSAASSFLLRSTSTRRWQDGGAQPIRCRAHPAGPIPRGEGNSNDQPRQGGRNGPGRFPRWGSKPGRVSERREKRRTKGG